MTMTCADFCQEDGTARGRSPAWASLAPERLQEERHQRRSKTRQAGGFGLTTYLEPLRLDVGKCRVHWGGEGKIVPRVGSISQ